jgi:hypothetical protein
MNNGLIGIKAKRYYKDPGVRKTCHDVKQTSNTEMQEHAIQTIAQDLIERNVAEPGDILIPAP